MNNTKIVVMSKSYEASLGIAHSLKIGGFNNVDLFFIGNKNIVSKSNSFNMKYYIPKWNEEIILAKLIETYKGNGNDIILFFGDDRTTSLADRHRDELTKIFRFTFVDGNANGAITRLMDKQYQSEMSKDYGLPMVQSWTLEIKDGVYDIPSDIVFPCFVKPLVSANGPAKSIMSKCESRETLSKHLSNIVKKGYIYPILVQEYVVIEDEFNIHGICDGTRIYLPIIHKKEATAHFNKGVTILGKNLDPSYLEPHLSKLKNLLLSNGYHGIFNVEMFYANNQYYLNEINYRIAGTCWGASGAGTNIPSLWCETLLGNVNDWPKCDVKFNTIFINDKTAAEDLASGYCTLMEFIKWNMKADFHLIYNKDDMNPGITFGKGVLKRYMYRVLKQLIRK